MRALLTVSIEDGESVGGLVDRRSERAEVLFPVAMEGEGVGGDGDGDYYSGELGGSDEECYKRHRIDYSLS